MATDCPYVSINSDDKRPKISIIENYTEPTQSRLLWKKESIAIPLTYICVGFLISFPNAYIQYYPRQLGASDSQQSTISKVRALPWTFKIFYGFLADAYPIKGKRFTPYMVLGYMIFIIFSLTLSIIPNPSIVTFTMLLLGSMTGIIMADVMGDALVAIRAKQELPENRGEVQSIVYMIRFLSEVVGYWMGSILCNPDEWGWGLSLSETFYLLTAAPLFIVLPSIYFFKETKQESVEPLKVQLSTLWDMIQLRAVWQPLSFIVIYNALTTYNASWGNYLKVAFHFSAFQYGSMSAVGATVALCGVYAYRKYFIHRANNWRVVYVFTTIVIVVFSFMNVLLVFRINEKFGIPAFWFAMGDSAVQKFAYGVQYLPSAVMFVSVCPHNQEGSAFAMLTGFQNLAGGLASTISNLMLGIWPVQLADLNAGYYDGVWKLSVLSNCINLVPLIALPFLLPGGLEDLKKLKTESSRLGGVCTLAVWVTTFIWVMTMSILAVTTPCLALVGGKGC